MTAVLLSSVRRLGATATGMGFVVAVACAAQPRPCDAMAGFGSPARALARPVSATDLAQLRDIGRADTGTDQAAAFDVSPDGKAVAFVVRRADPAANRYCQSLVIVPRDGGARPTTLARLGDAIRLSVDLRGSWMPLGMSAVIQPKWSPDGRRLAFIAKRGAIAQILVTGSHGGPARMVTHAQSDVVDLAWSAGGQMLVYSVRPELGRAQRESTIEARRGFLFGNRSWPAFGAAPLPAAPVFLAVRAVSPRTGIDRRADPRERMLLQPLRLQTSATTVASATLGDGSLAWTEPVTAGQWASPMRLIATRLGRPVPCVGSACEGRIGDLWADQRTASYVYLRREGWGGSVTGVYRWRLGATPVRILATEGLLLGCRTNRGELICGREGSLQPRRLVAIDLASGRERVIFNPNPEFGKLALGSARRLHWTADLGVEGFGDLVLPPRANLRQPLPLIVVQYRTRGFLRGSIGDEVPIQALAGRGFAVLSVENTPDYAAVTKAQVATFAEAAVIDFRGWAERRLILSSLVAGVREAEAAAPVDANRLGITGLSDGASTAWFALINTRLFSVASISTPVWDPASTMPLAGPALQTELRRWGFPAAGDADPAFWQPVSPALNAARIDAPLLLQYCDDEYLMGMEAVTALQEAHRAVELRVFPNEHHVKWQPTHRLAAYERNIDWFDFWLRRHEDPAPDKRDQYRRWRALRDRACQSGAGRGAPDPAISPQLCNQASTSTSSDTLK